MLNLGKASARAPSSQGVPWWAARPGKEGDGYQSKDGSLRANGRDITLPNGQTLFLGNADSDAPEDSVVMLCVNGRKMEPGMNNLRTITV